MEEEQDNRIEYLVNGYMRKRYASQKLYDQFESSLILIMMELLGNIFIMFDVYPSKCKSMISNNGKIFKRNLPSIDSQGSFTFGCSIGWNKGIHKISIQAKSGRFGSNVFGITTDMEYYKTHPVWYSRCEKGFRYAMKGDLLVACGDLTGNNTTQWGIFDKPSKAGDILEICLNADEWTVTFSMNDKQLGKPMKVIPATYHLFVCSAENASSSEYHVL